ncbi:Aminotransferase [Aspergillus sclerotialis]|uniref:Aminotransferase n=1 Tax=Aspergillus sclerotialis TaxID=2070753 RepID=A0A3A2ZD50_9EURO|nr:Aminotransferase [Aspergillus sclerotialis]
MGSLGNAHVEADGCLLHRSLVEKPAIVDSAEGVNLYLSDGRTILDACGGAAVALIGHGNQEVNQAIIDQIQKVSYVHTQSYTTQSAEDLANFLLQGRPHGLEKAFFVGSGSEAVESALKLARQYYFERGQPDRLHIVSRRQCYHGNTVATMSISGNLSRKVPFANFCYPNTSQVSPAYSYRYMLPGETQTQFTRRLLQELEDEFLRVGPANVLAFVAEPVAGAVAGCVIPPPGYLAGVRALCDKYDILLILDEIMCGVGRTGSFFAFEQEGDVVPDIMTVAKGLGGGYSPISGVFVHRKVVNVLKQGSKAFNHGHTYQAHPISCAAALAVQKIVRRDNLIPRCAEMGKRLENILRAELKDCWSVGDIRGRGLFWAVEFVKDRDTKETFCPSLHFGIRVQQAAFERGLAIYPGVGTVDGYRGDHILLAPPFTITEDQLRLACRVLRISIETQEVLLS